MNQIPIGAHVYVDRPLMAYDGRTGHVIGHGTRDGWPACNVAFDDIPDSNPGAADSALIPERHLKVMDGGDQP